MKINLPTIADFTNTTKETTTMITTKVHDSVISQANWGLDTAKKVETKVSDTATFNPISNRLRERKIAKLVEALTQCTSLEQEMPLRRELTALYAVNDIALARK